MLPALTFPPMPDAPASFGRFITADEVDAFLTSGNGGYSHRKYRILSTFLRDTTPKEREQRIKDEYSKVDLEYMQSLTGFTAEKIVSDLAGVIFYDFGNPNRSLPNFDPLVMKLYEKYPLVTADEYLSGNVREKLAKAIRFNEFVGDEIQGVDTTLNIKALTAAQPKDLDASEIAVRLGSTWVDRDYIRQFIYELLQPSRYMRNELAVNFSEHTGEWNIAGKTRVGYGDVLATVTYGTERANRAVVMTTHPSLVKLPKGA